MLFSIFSLNCIEWKDYNITYSGVSHSTIKVNEFNRLILGEISDVAVQAEYTDRNDNFAMSGYHWHGCYLDPTKRINTKTITMSHYVYNASIDAYEKFRGWIEVRQAFSDIYYLSHPDAYGQWVTDGIVHWNPLTPNLLTQINEKADNRSNTYLQILKSELKTKSKQYANQ